MTKLNNFTTNEVLHRIDDELNCIHKAQLYGLVSEYGYLGAIEYLDPTKTGFPDGRDQVLIKKHLEFLTSLK